MLAMLHPGTVPLIWLRETGQDFFPATVTQLSIQNDHLNS